MNLSDTVRRSTWVPALALVLGLLAALLWFSGRFGADEDYGPVRHSYDRVLNIMVCGDPFADHFQTHLGHLSEELGWPLHLSVRRYARTLEMIRLNARDEVSQYALVSFDVLWLPSLVRDGILSPLTSADWKVLGFSPEDFYPLTKELNRVGDSLYGLPVQPHPELLWYRRDLLADAGMEPPETLAELLLQARHFHRPDEGLYGIGWNGLRGQALGQTISHLYAAFGGSVFDAGGEPEINSPTGHQVIEFLQELMKVSPPDILTMAWDQRIERFRRGQAAFTYGWAARAPLAEHHPASQVSGVVGYRAAPAWQAGVVATPFGQWSLGLPANLPPEERVRALKTMRALLSADMHLYALQSGLPGLERRLPVESRGNWSEVAKVSHALVAKGALSAAARPGVEAWPEVAEVLGTVFHDMLLGKLSGDEALKIAQQRAEEVLIKLSQR